MAYVSIQLGEDSDPKLLELISLYRDDLEGRIQLANRLIRQNQELLTKLKKYQQGFIEGGYTNSQPK